MLTATSQFGTRVPENSCLRASFYSNRGARSFLESEMKTKICTRCHSEYPSTDVCFTKDKRASDGLGSWCRVCAYAASSHWAKAHPEKIREYSARWQKAHPEVGIRWRKAHPEKVREYHARSKAADPGYHARWQANHPELVREYNARRKKANPTKIRESCLKWRAKHPDAVKAHNAVNHAVEAGRLVFPSVCSKCGKGTKGERLNKHHPDYSKPFDVIVLCPKCHKQVHREAKEKGA